MDVSTILDIITAHGFETDDVLTDDRKVEAINEAYWDIAARNSWPFLEASVDLTFDGVTGTPTDWPSDVGAVGTVLRDDIGRRLEPSRLDDFLRNFGSNLGQQGSPWVYYFEGEQLKVYPIPPATQTITLKYLKVPAELTADSVSADILLPPRYHRGALVNGALYRLYIMQDDVDLSAAFERLYEKTLSLMADDLLTRQTDRPDYIHINDSDNWDYS